MHRYQVIFLAVMIPVAMVGAKLPVLLSIIVALFAAALSQPLWVLSSALSLILQESFQ
jgi:hypothetical protein